MTEKSHSTAVDTGPLLFAGKALDTGAHLPNEGFLVTNHLNLEYMLTAGLIFPPSGFGGKYYRDTLELFPGWIPVFPTRVFADMPKIVVSESNHLRPCIVKLRLESLSGRAFALREKLEEIRFPDGCSHLDRAYLFPAPLPAHWIKQILYRSAADKKACELSANEVGNVPLRRFNRRVDRSLFMSTVDEQWPRGQEIPCIKINIAMGQTSGGIAAMLFHLANRGSAGVDICRLSFDPDDQDAAAPDIPILSPLRSWLKSDGISILDIGSAFSQQGPVRAQQQIFWGSVDKLIAWRSSNQQESAEDIVVAYLRSGSRGFAGELRGKFEGLAGTLESLGGFADLSVSDVFRTFQSPFSRAMTLFLIRRSFSELLEFQDRNISEADMLAAAILFAAREGWERLPLDLRETGGLYDAICHRMAALIHVQAGTGTSLGEAPPRCRPLREVFAGRSKWRRCDREAALLLARRFRWDCTETVVNFEHGEYRLHIDRNGMRIVVDGEPKAVFTDVNRRRFLERLALTRLSLKLEEEVRRLLEG